jgi:hypothetical protein
LSAKLVGWALEQEGLEPQEKLLLVILADHFNDKEGAAWAGQARIAKMMGVSDRQVRRLQVSLVDKGTTTCGTQIRSIKHVQNGDPGRIVLPPRTHQSYHPGHCCPT